MSDRTTLLFALPAFRVLEVSLEPDGGRRVLVESLATEGGCPGCGVLSALIKDRPTSRIKDLPHGPVPLREMDQRPPLRLTAPQLGSASTAAEELTCLFKAVPAAIRLFAEVGELLE